MAGNAAMHQATEADQPLGVVALRDRPVAEAVHLPVVDPALQLRFDGRKSLWRRGRAETVDSRVGMQSQQRVEIAVPGRTQQQAAGHHGGRYGGDGFARLTENHETARNSVKTLGYADRSVDGSPGQRGVSHSRHNFTARHTTAAIASRGAGAG